MRNSAALGKKATRTECSWSLVKQAAAAAGGVFLAERGEMLDVVRPACGASQCCDAVEVAKHLKG